MFCSSSQAVIIALICMFAWGSCVSRARRLQVAVSNFNNNPAPAGEFLQRTFFYFVECLVCVFLFFFLFVSQSLKYLFFFCTIIAGGANQV